MPTIKVGLPNDENNVTISASFYFAMMNKFSIMRGDLTQLRLIAIFWNLSRTDAWPQTHRSSNTIKAGWVFEHHHHGPSDAGTCIKVGPPQ